MTGGARALGAAALGVGTAAVVLSAVAGAPASLIAGVFYLVFPVVGLVIARHQPGNVVAAVFMVSTLLLGIEVSGQQVDTIGLRHGWPDPVLHVAAWAQSWPWFPGLFVLVTVGLLRFPDGRPPGARGWRWVEVASYAAMAVWSVGIGAMAAMVPTAELIATDDPHPRGLAKIAFLGGEAMFGVIAVCTLASLASLVVRYRRAGRVAREQLKWVISAAAAAILLEIALDAYGTLAGDTPDWVQSIGEGVGFGLIAVAVGIAITRYKLYEIDRIVSRSVAYAVVLVVLAALYVAALLALAAVVPDDLGQLGVAVATLLVAALAVPLTRRVRRLVDHRFNRSRFDAERIVARFAADLRARPEVGDVPADLVAVLGRTVQPAHASVWLVPDPATT